MYVHGIDMYITHYVHTMSVRVYDMFVIFGFGIYMSTHIVKFTNMSATCLSPSIAGTGMLLTCIYHVCTRFCQVVRIPDVTVHLESCTPGQDWAKWYVLVRTSTYQYETVQGSTRIPYWYEAVCTGTYQYVLSNS